MKRRNFVKKSIAAAIVAATPLALTGLVKADGGGGTGSTSTDSTDWWETTGTTNDSTDESSTTESWTTAMETTVAGCQKVEGSIRLSAAYSLKGKTYTGMMCASYVNCPGQTPSLQRTELVPCDDNPNDGVVNDCAGVTLLTGQDAVTFKNLPVCPEYSEP